MRWYQRFFRRKLAENRLDSELRFHLEQRIADLVGSGMAREEARRQARIEFGGLDQVKEQCRDIGGSHIVEMLVQDIRFGLRQLRRNPGFTAVAVLTLALGIGANTAIFSVIDAVMLRKLPVQNPQELIQLATLTPYGTGSFSYAAFKRFRKENRVCAEMLAIGWLKDLDASIDGQPETVEGRIVSSNFFSMLGVSPAFGRTFTSQEEYSHADAAVAVISYGYWKRRFGRGPSVLGKSITLNRTPFTVVGVTPAGFSGAEVGYSPDIYVPMVMEPAFHGKQSWLGQPQYHWLTIAGRLKPGMRREQARADLEVIHRRILGDMPMKGWAPAERNAFLSQRLEVTSAASGIVFGLPKGFSGTLYVLMGMVGLVLLITCANLANLLLGRATVRQKEIAVRLAIGASRFRLIRQLLTESVMLAVAAGAVGVLLAYWASGAIVSLMSVGRSTMFLDLRPDPLILGFTATTSLLTVILFGLAPSLRSTRVDLTPALKESGSSPGSKRPRLGLGKGLVIWQVVLSTVLLFGAGLLLRTLENLENLDPGFNRRGVLLFDADPAKSGYKGPAVARIYDQILEHIGATPGFQSASLMEMAPITGGGGWDNSVRVEGYTPRPDEDLTVHLNSVGPKYFETLGTPVLLGRDFSARDAGATQKVAIINQTMARYFFGKSNPIGRKFGWFGEGNNKDQFEIVGVVKDSKYGTLREQIPRTAYLDCFQGTPGSMTFAIRTSVKPTAVISQIRSDIRAIDPAIRFGGFRTLEEHVDESLGHEHLMAALSSLFAGLAVLLACVGLYGIMAYTVARRTNEIGVRMALGASRVQIFRMVAMESALLIGVGVTLGLPIALSAARLIMGQLYGLRAADPVTIAETLLFLVSAGAVASYIPARRATKVDPMVALRHE